jgi:hypothetical protein
MIYSWGIKAKEETNWSNTKLEDELRDDEDHKRVCKSWFVMGFILFFKFSILKEIQQLFLLERETIVEGSEYLFVYTHLKWDYVLMSTSRMSYWE